MDKLIIRRAVSDDAEALLSYLNRVGGESDNLLFGTNGFRDFPIAQEIEHIHAANSGKNAFLIGIDNGAIVATAMLSVFGRERIAHRGTVALSVAKSYWHRGIGTAMLSEIIGYARNSGIAVLELTVREDNVHAIALYKKLGFVQIGIYKKYVCIDGRYYTSLLMNLYL